MGYGPSSTLQNGFTAVLASQMSHSAWQGLTFYDLIFPLFLFIVGVSLVFSLSKIIQRKGKWTAVRRVAVRSLLLFGLGVIYYGGFSTSSVTSDSWACFSGLHYATWLPACCSFS